mmetsp:Transcript_11901/g.30077  ORF Transcript_11901/g.30077 Transcript_11901/m.30077 type:complete len:205 (+) Transcript_11901:1122-1736(+)
MQVREVGLHDGAKAVQDLHKRGAVGLLVRPRAPYEGLDLGQHVVGQGGAVAANDHLLQHRHELDVREVHAARHGLIQRDRVRVHVRLGGVVEPQHDLRRKPDGVGHAAQAHRVGKRLRHAKVAHLGHHAVRGVQGHDQHVGALEVAVDDIQVVQVLTALAHVRQDAQLQVQRELPAGVHKAVQVAVRHKQRDDGAGRQGEAQQL